MKKYQLSAEYLLEETEYPILSGSDATFCSNFEDGFREKMMKDLKVKEDLRITEAWVLRGWRRVS